MYHIRMYFKLEIRNIVAKLGFKILESSCVKHNYSWDEDVKKEIEHDLVLISNDSKIVYLVEDINLILIDTIRNFIKIKIYN